jgi:hypothetical protein
VLVTTGRPRPRQMPPDPRRLPVVARIGGQVAPAPSHPNPGNAQGDRAIQLQHAIQDFDGNANLGGAATLLMNTQTVPDHLSMTSDGSLNPAAFGVARYLLPSDPAFNRQCTASAGRAVWGRFRRLAQLRRGAGWHHDHSVKIVVDDAAIDAVRRGMRGFGANGLSEIREGIRDQAAAGSRYCDSQLRFHYGRPRNSGRVDPHPARTNQNGMMSAAAAPAQRPRTRNVSHGDPGVAASANERKEQSRL